MITYEVKVKTGDKRGAGTEANVELVLLGRDGKLTKPAPLCNWYWNDFERGQLDVFTIEDDMDIPDVIEIKLRRDSAGVFSNWFVEKIEVTNQSSGIISVFPILRWIRQDVDLFFGKYDTFLPQCDPRPEQRDAELQRKRKLYEYIEPAPGLPVQVKTIPEDEEFTNSMKFNLLMKKYGLRVAKFVELMFGRRTWETFDDIKTVQNSLYGYPKEMQDWENDTNFGWQRLNGVNSNLIRLCTEIPEKFGVTEEMVEPFLEGLTLAKAIFNKRLFIIDLEILEGVHCMGGYICPVPIVLFFVDAMGQLKPLAIQLFQQKGPENPVFLPSDPTYTWLSAKMWYNVADSSYHQAITHLGNTHLIMEGFCLAAQRCLSPSHPMFKLLAPHFLYLIAINDFGRTVLISSGGIMDKLMAIGSKGVLELVQKHIPMWRMDTEGTYPEFLKNRGLYCKDGSILPMFYHRDDSLALYEAIQSYVTRYVHLYYDSRETLLNDAEIQHFGRELTTPKSEGGCGFLGVPFENGKFSRADELVLVLTCGIFTSSVLHASANFAQFDVYGYPPNYPFKLKGVPPTTKNRVTEEDLVQSLMDKSETLDAMRITKILSERSTNALGDFEVKYTYDPAAVEIVDQFRKELMEISAKIRMRNETVERKYEYLLPEEIPNSISI